MSSRPQHRSRPKDYRHLGQWILMDADLHDLLAIATHVYPAVSARTTLDLIARRALLPALQTAIDTRRPVDKIVRVQQNAWHVYAEPLLGVASGVPIAVLGRYSPPDAERTPPPPVGTWEWHVTPPGGAQQLHTHVSPATYQAYGALVDPSHDISTADSSTWQDDYLALADRPLSREFFMNLLDSPALETRMFDFIAGPPDGKKYALRCTGRRYDHDGDIWLRGLTFRRTEEPVAEEARHLDAVLKLSRDPVWLIDPEYEVIYVTTDNLTHHDLRTEPTRSLVKMCHPDDLPLLRDHIRRAAAHPGHIHDTPVHVRFATQEGSWRQLTITGVGVRISENATSVWCRVSTPSP